MFLKSKETNLLALTTISFGLILEAFYFTPKVLILVLGYFVVLGSILLNYDTHFSLRHDSPFATALLEHKHIPAFIKKWGFIFTRALHLRFKHLYHSDHLIAHFYFLIQPTFLYWSAASLIFFFVNPWFSQGIIIATTICYLLVMASVSQIYKNALNLTHNHLHILSVTKLLIVFLSFFAAYGYYNFGFIGVYQELVLIMSVTVIFLYQYAWKTGKLFEKSLAWSGIFWAGLLSSGIGYLTMWGRMNYFLAVVILFAFYFICFGILKHYLKGDLTKKMVIELVVSAILLTALVYANSYFDNLVL